MRRILAPVLGNVDPAAYNNPRLAAAGDWP
jgi:hypothetical protein